MPLQPRGLTNLYAAEVGFFTAAAMLSADKSHG